MNAQERAEFFMLNGGRTKGRPGRDRIVYYAGDFYEADQTHWVKIDPKLMRRQMYTLDEDATPYRVDAAMSVLVDKLCIGPRMPQDLGGNVPEDVENLLPMQNGLLHVPSLSLYAPDRDLFTTYSLPFAYDPDAPTPDIWLETLDQWWPGDEHSKLLLQQFMGYVLLPNTIEQKMLLLYGPPRSGKGTIIKTITELMGKGSVVAATLQSLAGRFGMESLIGKPLCVISESRFNDRTSLAVLEKLLMISGTDLMPIEVKYGKTLSVELATRVIIATNELPSFRDPSGSLAQRFLVLKMDHSFSGKEATDLRYKLAAVLPGILNWTIRGRYLQQRDGFIEPKASIEVQEELGHLGSPVRKFISDRCVVGKDYEIPRDQLYIAYAAWCCHNKQEDDGPSRFGVDLAAAVPSLGHTRPGGTRTYHGIDLLTNHPEVVAERSAAERVKQDV